MNCFVGGGELLSLGRIGGGGGDGRSAGYYTASVAKGRDDYYTGKGEAAGEWFGVGAGVLGLVGEVDADDFQAVVMDATDPRRGERLRRQVGDRPVQGMDMTFSAPKSVSLLFFLSDEGTSGAVRQAHDEAVGAALGYMEREACVVRSGKAGRGGKEAAEGFVGGVFRHRTSRALDPQLHTHAVVANLARRSDGRYIALDATAMFSRRTIYSFRTLAPMLPPASSACGPASIAALMRLGVHASSSSMTALAWCSI